MMIINSYRFGAAAPTFDSDYQAVLDRADTLGYTKPSSGQQTLQNQLVLDLKSAGAWSQLDTFYCFATDGDSDFATLNWIAPTTFQATKVNSPTFTANEGFAGDGSAAYLDTGYNPSTDATNFLANDASAGVWVFTADSVEGFAASLLGYAGTDTGVRLMNQASTNARINSGNPGTNPSFNGTGLKAMNKTSAGNMSYYNNTTNTTATSTDVAIQNHNIHLLKRNTSYGDAEISFGYLGGSLDSEHTNFYNALNDYITGL